MPKYCCTICADKISDFYEFRLMCKLIEIETRKVLGLPPPLKAKPIVDPPIITADSVLTKKQEEPKLENLPDKKAVVPAKAGPKSAKERLKKKQEPVMPDSVPPPSTQSPVPSISVTPTLKLPKLTIQLEKINPTLVLDQPVVKKLKAVKQSDSVPVAEEPKRPTDAFIKRKAEEALGFKCKPLQVSLKRLRPSDFPKPKVKCIVCVEAFQNDGELYAHLYNSHVPSSYNKFGCSSCGYSVSDKNQWLAHKKWHFRQKEPYICIWCHEIHERFIEFSKHFASCTSRIQLEVTQPDIRCELCKRKFITRNLYEWHNCFIKHRANCRKCGEYFAKKEKLFTHFLDCSLPFIEVPKPEPVDNYTRLFPDHAAKMKKVATKKIRQTPLLSDHATPTNVNEGELLIKSEDGEIEGDISSLLETSLDETVGQPSGIEAISNLLDSVNAAIEKISSVSKKKKKKGKGKNMVLPTNKRIEPLKLRLKAEFNGGNSTDNSQSGINQDEDVAYIPQYEHYVDIGSDDDEAASSLRPSSSSVRIKQEKLNEAYGDRPSSSLTVPSSVRIKQEKISAQLNKPPSAQKLTRPNMRIKQEHTEKDFSSISRQIKKEKLEQSLSSGKKVQYSATLARKIKQEKGTKKLKNIAINPIAAAAKKKNLLKIPSKLALKIKQERVNKQKTNSKAIRVKQERLDSDRKESQAGLSLNPLSVHSNKSFPTVQIPTSSSLLITSVVSHADNTDFNDFIRDGSVTPDFDELLTDIDSRFLSPSKTVTTEKEQSSSRQVSGAIQNGFMTAAQRKQGPTNYSTGIDSILDNNEEDYTSAMNAASEADDLLRKIDEQLKQSNMI